MVLANQTAGFQINISLEQSNEIVYFFICWYQKLRVDRKILGGVARNGCGHPGHKVNGWAINWIDQLSWFFMLMQIKES